MGLASRYKFEDLAVLLPVNMINDIVEYYSQSVEGGYPSIRPDPQALEKLERRWRSMSCSAHRMRRSFLCQTNLADGLLARAWMRERYR